jgi:hypothetical protein
MSLLIIVLIIGFAFFILKPANFLAQLVLAHRLGKKSSEISDDESYKLMWIFAVPVYLLLWWVLEITGLLSVIADEFR